jgi:CelD/BcsL family acetyltransferase involved in cellulose biosynthesis
MPARMADSRTDVRPAVGPEQAAPGATGEPTWSVLRHRAALEEIREDWLALYEASGTTNPFSHPAWVMTWLEHFAAPRDVYAVVARAANGELVAMAPFHRRRGRSGMLGRGLRLAGIGAGEMLTELPEILLAQSQPPRRTMRGLVDFLMTACARDWEWVELVLSPRLGWFESDWIGREPEDRGAEVTHTGTLAFVMLDLPADWETFRSGMKRNVREAVRRSTNRLAKVDGGWSYELPQTEWELRQAVDRLTSLHRARSRVTDKEQHGDYLGGVGDEEFLHAAALAMFRAGAATVPRIRIDGSDAAARLVLRGNGSIFYSLSGLDREHWDLGLGTQLHVQTLREAIERGDAVANLSANPDESKLRWGERLEVHNEFLVTAPGRRAQLAGTLYLLRRALRVASALWR